MNRTFLSPVGGSVVSSDATVEACSGSSANRWREAGVVGAGDFRLRELVARRLRGVGQHLVDRTDEAASSCAAGNLGAFVLMLVSQSYIEFASHRTTIATMAWLVTRRSGTVIVENVTKRSWRCCINPSKKSGWRKRRES